VPRFTSEGRWRNPFNGKEMSSLSGPAGPPGTDNLLPGGCQSLSGV